MFSYILPFSPIFSYICEKSSLQNFSLHKFLFFGFHGDYITEVGPFLKNFLFDFNFVELAHLQLCPF